jgi:hypothetical protein
VYPLPLPSRPHLRTPDPSLEPQAQQVDLEGIVAEIAGIAKQYGVRTVHGDRYSRHWVAQAFQRHGLRYDADHGLDKTAAYLEAEPLFAQGRIFLLDDPTQRRELVCLERRPRPGNKATVDHPNSAGAHDDYANALALAAALASRKPGHPMFGGWGAAPKGEEQKPAAPPTSEPWLPGRGVVTVASPPFYWKHPSCGNQRLVDPSVEKEPYQCPRCQPNWTRRDVLLRGRFS